MVRNGHQPDSLNLVLPITQQGRAIAQQFADQYPLEGQRKQIQLNTLAVWVANDYLTMLGIPTNLAKGDSWNSLMRLAGNSADLVVEGLGKLECRPVSPGMDYCFVPPETWDLRIGYLVVEINQNFRQAKLLGFTPAVQTDAISLQELNPLDAFIDHLHELCRTDDQPGATPSLTQRRCTNLSQWLNGIFTEGWQRIEGGWTLANMNPAYAFRGSGPPVDRPEDIARVKLINLGVQLGQCHVALVVQLKQESSSKTGITLQLHPDQGQVFLRPGIEFKVLDGDEILLQTQSRESDNYIQLKFSGEKGEPFKVLMGLGSVRVIEQFTI